MRPSDQPKRKYQSLCTPCTRKTFACHCSISEQHHLAPAQSRRRHKCHQGNAPLACAESMLNSSSGDTDSSASDRKAQSPKPDKSRAQESRRTTPRQIKQHQQRHNTSELKVSKPTSTLEKGPQKFADQPIKPYPADLATSLIRTASLHLRSTLSRLKRSNSDHTPTTTTTTTPTTKGIVTDSSQPPVVADHRCSDPPKTATLENHKAPAGQNERKMDGKVIPQVTLVAGPKFVDNRTREQPKPDSSPLPPGYSRWSTRLGPPPPTADDESANKNIGNSAPLRRPEPPSTGDFNYVPPKPSNTSTPIVQLEKGPLWKSSSLAPVYHSLPTGEADDLNLLPDDCADFGELGRINLRTGSFMGRYTQSRAQNTRPQFPSAQILYQRSLAPEATPNRLSPSRPLYLSPYQGTSSGNTTRSAPSPSLSSVTSAPGMSVQEPILARQKAVSLQSSRPNPDLSPLPKNAPVSSATPFVELDPVLTRLLLDVSSIDEYRSALRPQNVQTRSLSSDPNRISTTSEGQKSLGQSNLTANSLNSALGSSDPGSMGLLGNQMPPGSKQRTPSEELLEESWDLSQQINDLIQMEFACQAQRISPARAPPKTRTMPADHTRNGPRLSEPNVAVESDFASANGFGPGRRTRQHPFRWSSGAHHQSSQKSQKLRSETAAPHVQKNRPGSTVLTRGIEAGSLDRGLQSGKHQQMFVSVEPLGGDVVDGSGLTNSQLSEPVFYSTEGSTEDGRRVSFWSLNTVQMAVLRKLSLVQITSFAEKHCTNRSPFNWRFLKYRAIGVTGDSLVQAISPAVSPTANKKIDIHVSEPSPPTTNDSGVHQESVHAASLSQSLSPPLDKTPPTKPIDGDIHPPTPSRTAYTGPVFGQSLANWQRRLGYPLPAAIVHMMNHLERVGTTAHGIFRRPGGKIRTQALRDEVERDLTWNSFDDWQPYDVADLLKQFFRELPECLLTSKLSVVLVNLFNAVPESSQLDLLRWVVLGLPDENRVALQKLLYLLHSLLRYAHITQMSANNLAVCFAPSLFRLITSNTSVPSGVGLSPRRLRRTTSGPDPKDLADQRTAQLSLSAMITHAPTLFEISSDLLRRIHLAPPMNEPGELESIIPAGDWPSWIQTELRGLMRECATSRPKGWSMPSRDAWKLYQSGSGAGESLDGLEVYFKKPIGTNENNTIPPLRTWRCSLPIPEPNPQEILDRFWNQRASWDPEITRIQVIEDISDSVDVCLMINTATFPQPNCGLHLLRGRQCVLEDGGSAMLSQSVAPICLVSSSNTGTTTAADTQQLGSCPSGHVYEDHVYIKPLPDKSGCRVYLLSRVDLKGYSPDWYVNHWGHVLARRLLNLRRSFQPKTASSVGS